MIKTMTDMPTRVKTANLDDESSAQPVDEVGSIGHNQGLSRKPLRSLNLNAESKNMTSNQKKTVLILGAIAIVAGIGTGFGAFKLNKKTVGASPEATQRVAGEVVNNGDVFGVKDDQTFKDSAEGYLVSGGVDGEGSHSLLRDGGVSQTVYLTSSVTDLEKFVNMRVKVWGETFKGQKAGWLMDVGRVQVVEVNAEAPVTE